MELEILEQTPDLLVMEASYPGTGDFPPLHLHPRQEERFTVLEGTVVARIAGEERSYGAGEGFAVPAGTPHTMRASGPARTRWEVRPPLRTAAFFATLLAGTGGPSFLEDFAEEFRLVPT